MTTLGTLPLAVFLAKATLLLVAALVATVSLRRAPAGVRHLVWLATLVSVVVLPVLSRMEVLPVAVLPPSEGARGEGRGASDADLASLSTVPVLSQVERESPQASATSPSVEQLVPSDVVRSPLAPRPSPLTIAAGVWALVSAALLCWLAMGALTVRRIVRGGRDLSDHASWNASLCEVADRLDLEEIPRLVASEQVEMPFACGLLRPTIVLPATASEWSEERRRAVLFHELAHIRRRDLVGHTLGRVACALYWFHPLVWTAARRLRAESERACDDLVLSCGTRASDYAQHLLDMVTSVRRHGAPATALPMARRAEFEGRMLAILDPNAPRRTTGRAQRAAVVGSLAALSLAVAVLAPVRRASAETAETSPRIAAADTTDNEEAAPTRDAGVPPADRRSEARSETPTIVADGGAAIGAATLGELARRSDRIELVAPAPLSTPTPVAQPESAAAPAPSAPPADDPKRVAKRVEKDAEAAAGSMERMIEKATEKAAEKIEAGVSAALFGPVGQIADDTARAARIAVLSRVLRTDTDARVRRSAAWALQRAASPEAVTALVQALRGDASAEVREVAAWALAGSRDEAALTALAEALRGDAAADVRVSAGWALGNSRTRAADREALAAAIKDPSGDVREVAIWALARKGGAAPAELTAALADERQDVRLIAAWALGELADPATRDALTRAFTRETNGEVRGGILRALDRTGQVPREVLEAALASTDADLRVRAVSMLAGRGAGSWAWPWPWPWPRPHP